MGFAQSLVGGYGAASQYDAQKRQALIAGEAQRNAAYAKASASERASKQQLHLVGENMARMAGNKRREAAQARTESVASGFALEGSVNKREDLVNKAYDAAMDDMARSGSVASMNALDEQIALRRGGDAAMQAAEAQAAQYRAMAKATRTGAFMSAMGGLIGAAGSGGDALSAWAKKDADGNVLWDTLDWDSVDWKNVGGHAIQGATGVSGVMNALNPVMAGYATQGWDKHYLTMLGVGKTDKK